MTDITNEALIERGFKHSVYDEDEVPYTIYKRKVGEVDIELTNTTFIEIGIRDEWVTVPNCRTLTDLDNLIKLFV